jgi:hypothetical protein
VASLIVAVLGVAWNIGWNVWRDRRTTLALESERDERRDQLALENGRREEELQLLRLQVEHQSQEANRSAEAAIRRAELVARATGYSGSTRGVEFPIAIRNVGEGVARDLSVWLAIAPTGGDAVESAASVTQAHEIGALTRDEGEVKFGLEQQGASAGGGVPRDGLIVASWLDDAGKHVAAVGKLTVFL